VAEINVEWHRMPLGGREKLPPWQNVAYKFKRWQLYCIYDIIATIIFFARIAKNRTTLVVRSRLHRLS